MILDLSDEEHAELVRLVRDAIDGDRYFMSSRATLRRRSWQKLDPASARAVTPHPAPRPAGTPSLVYQRLKAGRRRR